MYSILCNSYITYAGGNVFTPKAWPTRVQAAASALAHSTCLGPEERMRGRPSQDWRGGARRDVGTCTL